jgi:hypothetical protein
MKAGEEKGCRMTLKPDRSTWAVVIALLLSLFSVMSFGLFVHTYCENRPVIVALAAAGAGTGYFLLRTWPAVAWRRAVAILALVLCLFEIGFNLWYFAWATRVCAEQLRSR